MKGISRIYKIFKNFFSRRFISSKRLGCIEIISPKYISGWVISNKFSDVRLLIGNYLVASSNITIKREDVNNILKTSGHNGYLLELPLKLNQKINSREKIKIVAINGDGSENLILNLLQKPKTTEKRLREVLFSNYLGWDGCFNGISEDRFLTGWVYRKGNGDKDIEIWLQSENIKPVPIMCNTPINIVIDNKYVTAYSFKKKVDELPIKVEGSEIFLTFDYEGKVLLPQQNNILIKKKYFNENLLKTEVVDSFTSDKLAVDFKLKSINSSIDLKHKWLALEDIQKDLSKLEDIISKSSINYKRKNRTIKFIGKFVSNLIRTR